ncbi:hypothetical protein DYB37_006054 [Aphanomyces astaci]|uniref:Uncharacterized protein n=1 Tax=Aphanomyces astaci TaxID=112090 RepID=A0A418FF10_APHAT|nr:hypothetical protein DYB35_005480 [Aphanomyces astaci]RHZ28379.1 hypothetical protein DYB37_006054 [Aphanomyces astaci]
MEISQPQSARFLSDNMELLGFGDPCSALIQAVKELFENGTVHRWKSSCSFMLSTHVALDAIQYTEAGMIAVRLKEVEHDANVLEIVCTDTGIGLKAALLYSQNHASIVDSSLKVTSTLNSSEFYYAELVIDPEAHDNGYSKRFHVSEAHKSFSGTEIRLQLPRPHHLVDALRMLMPYFDNLRYCLAASVSVDFSCDIPGFDQYQVCCASQLSPLERFLDAFKCPYESLAHANVDWKSFHVNCLALSPYLDETNLDGRCPVTIHIMRFANHVPLLPRKDVYACAMTIAVQRSDWKALGYKCVVGASMYAPLQLVPLSINERSASVQEPKHVVVAIDVDTCGAPAKFTSLTKTALVEASYLQGVSQCMALVLDQLARIYPILFRRANRSHTLATEYAPLIATAVSSILVNATYAGVNVEHFEPGRPLYGVQSRVELDQRVLDHMTSLLRPHS